MRPLAYWLGLVFVFTVPWEAAVQIGGVGRGSKLVGLTVGLVWLVSVLGRGRLREPALFQKALFLFLAWSGMTVFWSLDTGETVSGFRTHTQIFVMTLILWDLFDTRKAIESALQAYVLGAFVTSGSIIANYLTAPETKYPAHERVNALGFETDGIALIVATAGPAAWYLAAGPSSPLRRTFFRRLDYAYLPVGLWAIVLTGTRGATLASIPTALFVLWSLRSVPRATRSAVLASGVVVFVMVLVFAPQGQVARIETAVTATELGEEGGALSGRWSIWAASMRLFLERPIGGVGLDAHRVAVSVELGQGRIYKKAEKEAHNTYVSVLTETGIVGFVLFGTAMFGVVLAVRRLRGWEAWYWSAQLSVLAIGAVSLSLEDSKPVWIFLSLAVSFAAAPRPVFTGSPYVRTVSALRPAVPARLRPHF